MAVLVDSPENFLYLPTTHKNLSKIVSYLEIRKYNNLNLQVTLDFKILIFKYSSRPWGAVGKPALSALLGSSNITFSVYHLAKYKRL